MCLTECSSTLESLHFFDVVLVLSYVVDVAYAQP